MSYIEHVGFESGFGFKAVGFGFGFGFKKNEMDLDSCGFGFEPAGFGSGFGMRDARIRKSLIRTSHVAFLESWVINNIISRLISSIKIRLLISR